MTCIETRKTRQILAAQASSFSSLALQSFNRRRQIDFFQIGVDRRMVNLFRRQRRRFRAPSPPTPRCMPAAADHH